nr:hypothetical protein CFP56_41062 [Quercus suber]
MSLAEAWLRAEALRWFGAQIHNGAGFWLCKDVMSMKFSKKLLRKIRMLKPSWAGLFGIAETKLEQGIADIGLVVQNSEGAVMASLSQQVPLPTIVAQVETMAARKAAELALKVGLTKVIIEGDSNTIFRELNSTDPSIALHGHVI